ncbi:MAG: HIT domain-containing protein [Corynebacterium humireducens]|uniref:HIT domain-containing protein n=1 Tax=Corynebacterium humireducens TaxID=1223514 RepID=A0A7X6SVW3_9CORY|nr:HIT domain-containing protein [Corynebacterium humireducens]
MAGDACSFCLIVAGEDRKVREVYRTDHVVALQPIDPATLGHLLVIPRRHVANIWGLNPSEADHLAQATRWSPLAWCICNCR